MAYDVTIPHWPRRLLPQNWGGAPVNGLLTGPQPFVGPAQTNVSPSGVLQWRLDNIPLYDPPRVGVSNPSAPKAGKIHLYRALYSRLSKGAPIYMPVMDWRRGPRVRAGLPIFGPLTPFSDGATFSDSATFTQDAGDATIAAVAAAQSWAVTIDVVSSIVPEGGDWIGLGDRAYLIEGAWPDDAIANRYRITLDRWLREPVAIGDAVEFADPFCRMVLAPKSRGQIVPLTLGVYAYASLEFIEAYWG
jgi:hypothetical protein